MIFLNEPSVNETGPLVGPYSFRRNAEIVVTNLFPGDDWYIPFQIDPRFAVVGTTFNFRFFKPGGTEITLTTTTIEITDRTAGIGLLSILHADTVLLTPGTYFFRLGRTSFQVSTLWSGRFQAIEAIPRG